ncbi:MATE family efflux transporter [Opitutaceae bacterium]|nr:MATE family efflux transporter [Opitutaceae bacterium]MDB4474504.1 MATE family efflux transporter [Opitutaceae bacterium]
MDSPSTPRFATYADILRMAWPVALAGISTPLLGLVDSAIIGQTRPAAALGAIAVGSLFLSCIYWMFGFLRMSTTGFVAQAEGAGNALEMRAASIRALLLGSSLGVLIVILQWPLVSLILPAMGAQDDVFELSLAYINIRVWAAPATLVTYALSGILIGLGKTRSLLVVQLLLNGLNIGLDLLLGAWLDLGVTGIAYGTLIAEWVAALTGIWIVWQILRARHRDASPFLPWTLIKQADAIRATMVANGNIMVRSFCMLAGIAWFTRLGAQLGDTTLAANHVLLGISAFCAYFLDGIAFPTEALTGAAKGRKDLPSFDHAVHHSTVISGILGAILALLFWTGGEQFIFLITDIPEVIDAAVAMLPFAVIYNIIAFAAFQLDGIFIGTTYTREMRNSAIISVGFFAVLSIVLTPMWGPSGMWLAMVVWIIMRTITLLYYFPKIRRNLN